MITPKEKLDELYNRFDMIIYTAHDGREQVSKCMDYFIESMIDEFHNHEQDLEFWEIVKLEKEKMKF